MPYCWALLLVTLVTFRFGRVMREVECVADDPLAAERGEDRRLQGNLCNPRQPRATADAGIFALRVLADDDEIDALGSGVAQRACDRRAAAGPGARQTY